VDFGLEFGWSEINRCGSAAVASLGPICAPRLRTIS
jgi:hypothetical protein